MSGRLQSIASASSPRIAINMGRTLAFILLFGLAVTARAGIVDWFNGVSTGAELPVHDGQLVSGQVPRNARLTLIDFWVTWCAPCRNNVPRINALAEKYTSQGLAVVAVSMEKPDVVAPHLPAWGMRYAVIVGGNNPLQTSLSIRALPYAILVSKSNKIVWRGMPEELTGALIESLLAKTS